MRKLKLFFACLLMAVLSIGQMWATDFTLSSAAGVTKDGITVSFAQGNGSNAPAWYSAGLRLYASNTITISCDDDITGVTFNWEKQGNKAFASVTASPGSYSHPSAAGEGTWSGSAKSITFTLGGSGQLQLNTLSVTLDAGETPTPTLSIAPTIINFGTVEQGTTGLEENVAVTFANLTGSVTYSELSSPFTATGTISNTGDNITIAADASVAIGEYEQTLTVQSANDNKSADVTVRMNVIEPFNGLQLTFPDEGTEGYDISSYTADWTATMGSHNWDIYGFNSYKWQNNWTYIKTGRKKDSNNNAQPVTATIVTQVTDHAVGDIVVTVDAVTATQVTSHKLYVADNSSFDGAIEIAGVPATIAAGNITYTVPIANRANDLYYKLEYATAGTASSNGILTISKITYAYATAAPQKQNTGIAYENADKNKLAKVGASFTAPTLTNPNTLGDITYASSDDAIVEVNPSTGAIVEIKAEGKAVITASREADDTYKAGSASYTIYVATEAGTAGDPLSEASAKALIDLGCTMSAHVTGTVQSKTFFDNSGSYNVTLTNGFMFYYFYAAAESTPFESDILTNGDVLVGYGSLMKYGNNYEINPSYMVSRVPYTEPLVDISNTKETAYTVAQALALAANPSSDLTKSVYIKGIVYKADFYTSSSTYNIYIKDANENNKFEFFKCGQIYNEATDEYTALAEGAIQVGNEVIGYGQMTYYSQNDIYEFVQGNYLVDLQTPVTGVELDATAEVEVGSTVNLTASILPSNATGTIDWTVESGASYANVEDGVVTGLEAGEAVIRATVNGTEIYAECTVTVAGPAPLSPWASVYTSNVAIESNTAAHVTIGEGTFDAAKTSKGASATITLPQGVTTIHLHLVAWKDEAQTVTVSGDCFNEDKQLTIIANDGVSGQGTTYALGESGVDYYFSLTPDNAVAANEVITITAANNKRFVLFGVNQEGGQVLELESIAIDGTMTNKSGWKTGDEIIPQGLTVAANYTLGGTPQTPEDITNDPELVWSHAALTVGQTKVTLTATYKGQTDNIEVTLDEAVVSGDPEITTDVNSRSWTVDQNAATPAAKTVTVTLKNIATAQATLGGTNPEAFSISKTEGIVNGDVITISVLASTGTVASYSATITIKDDASDTSKDVNLTLTVKEPEAAEEAVSTSSEWVVATEIADGMEVLITGVKSDVTYAISEQANNNRTTAAGTLSEDVFTPGENTMSFTLVAQEGENNYALRTSNGKYLYAASSGSNQLKTRNEIEDDGKAVWTITIGEGNVASIVANCETENWRNVMQFNLNGNNNPVVACYASASQQPIKLYVPKPVTPVDPTPDYTRTVEINRYGTICLPNGGTIEGAKLYDIDYYDGTSTLYLLEVNGNAMVAGRPYIFLPSATSLEVFYTDDADEDAGTYRGLVGSYSEKTILVNDGNYILYENAYYLVNSAARVGENRAYIHMASVPTTPYQQQGAPRRRVTMTVYNEQTTTDIDALNASEAPVKMIIDGQMYILRGEKMYDATGRLVK